MSFEEIMELSYDRIRNELINKNQLTFENTYADRVVLSKPEITPHEF
jgi:hypothetical protein